MGRRLRDGAAVKARKPDDEPAEKVAGEDDERTGRGPVVVLSVIGLVSAWRLVVSFPEVAYAVVGSLGTIGWQKTAAWRARRSSDEAEDQEEAEEPPDVGEALRRLVGDDNGVLLTVLRDDLGLSDTKDVKALLQTAGIPFKPVRTREGNGPAVHRDAIPAVSSPAPADSHGEGCCCRSGDNDNGNNADEQGPGEGIRVERTETGLVIYDLADTHRHHTVDHQ
jgi:hypothetical protein